MPNPQSHASRPLPPFESVPDSRREAGWSRRLLLGLCLGVAAGCASNVGSLTPGGGTRHGQNISRALPAASPTPAPAGTVPCGSSDANAAGCHVQKKAGAASATPSGGLTPAQLRSAYGLPVANAGAAVNGALVAVVAAYEDKNAESDLAAYRAQFGLPVCSSANGCFTKVIMAGAKVPPGQMKKIDNGTASATWADEIALDLAMASAACPTCKLMLVEAGGEDLDSLASAVSTAASYHPAAISNSWGVVEAGNAAEHRSGGAGGLRSTRDRDHRQHRRPRRRSSSRPRRRM